MLNNAIIQDNDSVVIDGKSIHRLQIIARLISTDVGETMVKYLVDDGTGQVEVQYWNTDGESEYVKNVRSSIQLNTYVAFIGKVRLMNAQKQIHAFNVRPVKDYNEVTHHFLQAVFDHYQRVKGPLINATMGNNSNTSYGNMAGGYVMESGGGGGVAANNSGVDVQSKAVNDLLLREGADNDEGLSVTTIAKKLNMNPALALSICQALIAEGFLYSTIDEQHFKSTGSTL